MTFIKVTSFPNRAPGVVQVEMIEFFGDAAEVMRTADGEFSCWGMEPSGYGHDPRPPSDEDRAAVILLRNGRRIYVQESTAEVAALIERAANCAHA